MCKEEQMRLYPASQEYELQSLKTNKNSEIMKESMIKTLYLITWTAAVM